MKLELIKIDVVSDDDEFSLTRELQLAKEKLKESFEYKKILELEEKIKLVQNIKIEEKNKILQLMKENGVDNFIIGDYEFKITKGRKSKRTIVNIDPITLHKMRPDLVDVKYEISKSKVKDELEEGIYIEGCYIEENRGEDSLEVTSILKVSDIIKKSIKGVRNES